MKGTKLWLVAACATAIFLMSTFGTFAFLTDKTEKVTNTFTIGKLLDDPANSFVLKEHKAEDTDGDGVYTLNDGEEVTENAYKVLPGVAMPKDPFVKTTEALQLDAYVFVEVVDTFGEGTQLSYAIDDAVWTEVSGAAAQHDGGKIYALKSVAKAGSALAAQNILKEKTVTAANAPITDAAAQYGGSLTFYAYMIQAAGFKDAGEAWGGYTADNPVG